jgi:3',5'-cyclic AMP phosphodiesterase CpdA
MDHVSRRDALKFGAAALGLGMMGASSVRADTPTLGEAFNKRHRSLRLAHLTDIHIQPERGAGEGFAQCLDHIAALSDKPELLVTGGDLVMDSFGADDARTKLQWELFTKTLRDHNGVRVEHTLGNHDIWGWNKKHSKTTGEEKLWGKQRALETLGLAKKHHSYDHKGWHFVHLDSVQHDPNDPDGYIGKVDDEQMDWLKADLAGVKPGVHTLVVSHIPILSVTVILGEPDKNNTFKFSGGVMHTDSQALRDLFEKSGTVRACLSGHIHRLDRIDFRGIQYCCNGAVCGSWWKGPQAEAFEGYTLVDLFENGDVECRYTGYDWKARS